MTVTVYDCRTKTLKMGDRIYNVFSGTTFPIQVIEALRLNPDMTDQDLQHLVISHMYHQIKDYKKMTLSPYYHSLEVGDIKETWGFKTKEELEKHKNGI